MGKIDGGPPSQTNPAKELFLAAQSRPANKLVSPFLASQRPVSGVSTSGWTL